MIKPLIYSFRSSLRNRLKNPTAALGYKKGPDPRLGFEYEEELAEWIIELANRGLPITKHVVCRSVKRYQERTGEKCKINPGHKWWSSFLRRHQKRIMANTPLMLSPSREEGAIRQWFRLIYLYFEKHNLLDIISDPTRIFNADEICFKLCPNTACSVVNRTRANTDDCEIVPGSEGMEIITMMAAFGADGWCVPPMVVYPHNDVPASIVGNFPAGWATGASPTGWMNGHLFCEWIEQHFYPRLVEKEVMFPVILFIDGQRSHLSLDASELCTRLGIILISLPPNTAPILQPADVAVFLPLKKAWGKMCDEWVVNNKNETITRFNFSGLLGEVLDYFAKPTSVVDGFQRCGIYPFDADSVDYTKCVVKKEPYAPQNETFLEQLEMKIENLQMGRLNSFKESYPGDWNGPPTDKLLYDLWKETRHGAIPDPAYHNDIVIKQEPSEYEAYYTHNVEVQYSENEGYSSHIASEHESGKEMKEQINEVLKKKQRHERNVKKRKKKEKGSIKKKRMKVEDDLRS